MTTSSSIRTVPVSAAILREADIVWHFIKSDVSATILPATIFTAASATSAHLTPLNWVIAVLLAFFHNFLYIYTFDLSNQITSIEEDRINKPNRPLPSGKTTIEATRIRLRLTVAIYLILGLLLGTVIPDLLWVGSFFVYNHTPLGKTWLWKHINIGIGTWVMITAAWTIGGGDPMFGNQWAVCAALLTLPLIAVQDLRDIPGDLKQGRSTLPIILGETPTRLFIFIVFLIAPLYTHFTMFAPFGQSLYRVLSEIPPALLLLSVAIGTMLFRSRKADAVNYYLFTIWFVAVAIAALAYAIT